MSCIFNKHKGLKRSQNTAWKGGQEAQTDRSDAETEVSHATVLREKEAAAFAALKADLDANVVAIIAAIAALERGMAGGFVQTAAAQVLRKLILTKQSRLDIDRQEILSFLLK